MASTVYLATNKNDGATLIVYGFFIMLLLPGIHNGKCWLQKNTASDHEIETGKFSER